MQAIVRFVEGYRRGGSIAGAIVADRVSRGQQVASARASPTSSSSTWGSRTSKVLRDHPPHPGMDYGADDRALGPGPGGPQDQGARLVGANDT